VKEIPLANGRGVALVDDEDYEWLSQYSWRLSNGYAMAYIGGGRKNRQEAYMHNMILPLADGLLVDHKDRDGLNNRRSNLRPADSSQNNINRPPRNKFKGISFNKQRGKWVTSIIRDGFDLYVGAYPTATEAAEAYDCAAVVLHGGYAYLNFPDNDYSKVLLTAQEWRRDHGYREEP
jgi:hypothetical protein